MRAIKRSGRILADSANIGSGSERKRGVDHHAGSRAGTSRVATMFGAALAALAIVPCSGFAAEQTQAPTPSNSSAPALTGTPVVGHTLNCSTGAWQGDPDQYAYSWLRDGTPLVGQTSNSYAVQSADWRHSLSCQVTARNTGGEYLIGGLPTGGYTVSFGRGETNYLDQYFDAEPFSWLAMPVGVTVPSVTGNVNAALDVGGEITGIVTAADGGAPIDHLHVCAEGKEVGSSCAWTSSNGRYTIEGLPSGSYLVTFAPTYAWRQETPVYLQQYYGGQPTQESSAHVAVLAGAVTTGVDASMQRGGQVAGRVSAASGSAGIANVEVCARSKGERAFELTRCALTDEAGKYTVTGIVSGSYTIEFGRPAAGPSRPQPGNYGLPQYYDEKRQEGEGDPITVTAPETTPGIDASLQAGGQVAGRVTAASSGEPLAGISVCASQSDEACAITDGSGEYTLSGLATGMYRIEVADRENGRYLPRRYNEDPSEPLKEFVDVTAGNTTAGIDVELQAAGRIAGEVTDALTQQPLANVEVCLGRGIGPCTRTDAHGGYSLGGLTTGTYGLEAHDYEEGNHLAQTISGVPVSTGSTTSGVNVALPPGGEISGRVRADATGLGVAGISVCANEIGPNIGGGGCTKTNGPGDAAEVASNVLVVPVPDSAIKLARRIVIHAKTGELDFYFAVDDPGTLRWRLDFDNADVGYADGLTISDAHDLSVKAPGATRHICKEITLRHKRKCVSRLVPFASGSQTVPDAGLVKIVAHGDAKAVRALRAGHTLHVSGWFTFQSVLGGAPVTLHEPAVLRPPHSNKRQHKARPRKKK